MIKAYSVLSNNLSVDVSEIGIVKAVPSTTTNKDPYTVAINGTEFYAYAIGVEQYTINKNVLVLSPPNDKKKYILGGISDSTSISYSNLSNIPSSFVPSSHTHGNITNDGKIGSDAGKYLVTGSNGTVSTISASDFASYIFLLSNPVGSIYLSVSSVNPGTVYGGTWVAWGAGRVPVSVDASQTEFNTVEETGGEKTETLSITELPSHTHTQNAHSHSVKLAKATGSNSNYFLVSGSGNVDGTTFWQGGYTDSITATNQNTGGGDPHNNLQPYITCYMWKRVS